MAVIRDIPRRANEPNQPAKKKDRYIVRMINSPRKEAPHVFAIVFEADYPEEAMRMAQEFYGNKNKILTYQVEKYTNRR